MLLSDLKLLVGGICEGTSSIVVDQAIIDIITNPDKLLLDDSITTVFSQHSSPYVIELDDVTGLPIVIFSSDFITAIRLKLSYEGVILSERYQREFDLLTVYANGEVLHPSHVIVAEQLDYWIHTEIQELLHPEMTTSYSETHPWVKTLMDCGVTL